MRLKREGNPPVGQFASPVPQAWDPSINDYRGITGSNLGPGRFGTDVQLLGRTPDGRYLPIRLNRSGQIEFAPEVVIDDVTINVGAEVRVSGSAMELFGATVADRPVANAVPVGATYTAVNTQEKWQSNGIDWVRTKDSEFASKLYGMRINKNDSNPDTRVEYIYDAVGMTPAYMDFETGVFNYGSWDKFCQELNDPVVLNYDGSLAYVLDRTDQTKKADGSPSDISDTGFGGNVMSRFRRLWLKEWEDEDYEYVVFSFTRPDHSYHANAFTDSRGNVRDYMYHSAFEGTVVDGKLRSIADLTATASQAGATEIARAEANGPGWGIWYKSQRDFITYLLWMISKSTYDKQKFGMGNINSDTYLPTGTLKNHGQFMGYSDTDKAVKVFFIENFWGNYWKWLAGLIMDLDGQIYIKATGPYPQPIDNVELPAGYTPTGVVPSGGSGGYLRRVKMMSDGGLVPVQTGGSATTYYTAGLWYSIGSTVNWARVGGRRDLGALCGAGSVDLNRPLSYAFSHLVAALSFLENPS